MSASIAGLHLTGDRNMVRAMQRAAPPLTKPPPTGSVALQPPVMTSATGLGLGGGAAIDGRSDASYGHIRVFVGLAPSASGIITIAWPQFPAGSPLFWGCDWATLVVTGTVSSIITWTAVAPLVTSSRPLRIDWRWTVPV